MTYSERRSSRIRQNLSMAMTSYDMTPWQKLLRVEQGSNSMINLLSHHITSCAKNNYQQGSHQQKTTHAVERTNRLPVANETKEKYMQC